MTKKKDDEEKVRAALALGGKKAPVNGKKMALTEEKKRAAMALKGKKKK